MKRSLSVVLPCYNPHFHKDWVDTIIHNMRQIRQKIPESELIVVNDGTPENIQDGLEEIRHSLENVSIISYEVNRGKGYAIRQGIAKASKELVIYTDIDFPYQHESFLRIYRELNETDTDIVVGVKDEAYYEGVPSFRRYISKGLRWMIRNLLSISITDTQCGLKGFKSSVKHLWLEGSIDRYLFDLEMIYNAEQLHYRIRPLPVKLREGVEFSHVKMNMLTKELKNFLKIVWKSRRNKIRRSFKPEH